MNKPPDLSHRSAVPGSSPGLFHLYGRRPVIEALKLRLVKSLEIAGRAHGLAVSEILRLAEEQNIPVTRVESFPRDDERVSQNVRALALPPPLRRDLQEFVGRLETAPPPLMLMLDGITDPHNFGAILRSAEGAGVSAVVVRERRQVPLTDVVVKTSAGAAYLVPVFKVGNLDQTLRLLAKAGFWSVAAVTGDGVKSYMEYRWNYRTVLIVGAEGSGVSDLLVRRADDRVTIPMHGRLDSLNVSVAAAVLLFEAAKHRFERHLEPSGKEKKEKR